MPITFTLIEGHDDDDDDCHATGPVCCGCPRADFCEAFADAETDSEMP